MNRSLSIQEQKALLRNKLRQKLEGLKLEERKERSENILAKLFSHSKFKKSEHLLIYISCGFEVQTRSLVEEALSRDKKIYVPRIDPEEKKILMIETSDLNELKPGSYGVMEPPLDQARVGDPQDLDLAIVPGLGFDREGGRLGRGKGYFDRFLKEARNAYKIGLAFECQIVDQIPRNENDVLLDEVLIG